MLWDMLIDYGRVYWAKLILAYMKAQEMARHVFFDPFDSSLENLFVGNMSLVLFANISKVLTWVCSLRL